MSDNFFIKEKKGRKKNWVVWNPFFWASTCSPIHARREGRKQRKLFIDGEKKEDLWRVSIGGTESLSLSFLGSEWSDLLTSSSLSSAAKFYEWKEINAAKKRTINKFCFLPSPPPKKVCFILSHQFFQTLNSAEANDVAFKAIWQHCPLPSSPSYNLLFFLPVCVKASGVTHSTVIWRTLPPPHF